MKTTVFALNRPTFASLSVTLLFLLLGPLVVNSTAQVPLVYDVENTGAGFPKPALPTVDKLGVVRPLPDPFEFFDGSGRDTSFASWERWRNEIKAAIEKYERIGILNAILSPHQRKLPLVAGPRTAITETFVALVGFQGRGCADGAQPDLCHYLVLEALIFQ
jgi:hypothetical protein